MLVSSVAPSKRRALAPCIAPVTVTPSVAASPSATSPVAVSDVTPSMVPPLMSAVVTVPRSLIVLPEKLSSPDVESG